MQCRGSHGITATSRRYLPRCNPGPRQDERSIVVQSVFLKGKKKTPLERAHNWSTIQLKGLTRVRGTPSCAFMATSRSEHQTSQANAHTLPTSLSMLKPRCTHLLLSAGCNCTYPFPLRLASESLPYPVSWRQGSRDRHWSRSNTGNVERYEVPASALDILHRSSVSQLFVMSWRDTVQISLHNGRSCEN